MNIISDKDYKIVLIGILKYFDTICRKNNIKYSLIAGSMIGAVREGGIIPWDDDIDVILMPEEYEKLTKVLEKEKNERYKALIPFVTKDYYMPYIKIVDLNTHLVEHGIKQKKDSGVFIDVFKYGYFGKNNAKRKFRKAKLYRKILAGVIDTKKKNKNIKLFLKNIRRIIVTKLFTHQKLLQRYDKIFNEKKNKFVMINYPIYGPPRDLIPIEYTNTYIDCSFDGIKSMIFKDYDKILSITFGDYMTPPPEKERAPHHNMSAYWKK